MTRSKLAAFKVERRAVAAAIFVEDRLEYTQVRQLSSSAGKADESAVGFINWIISYFGIESAAIERVVNGTEIRRAQLTAAAIENLRSQAVAVWEFPKQELFAAYGLPPLRTRKELRAVITSIWPILDSRSTSVWIMDAVALGLFVQTERLFINYQEPL